MTLHAIWTRTNPELEPHLARASQDRAAAFWSAIGPLRRAAGWLAEAAAGAVARFAERRRAHAILSEIARLDARQLADVGLRPSDLDNLAAGRLPRRFEEQRARATAARPAADVTPLPSRETRPADAPAQQPELPRAA